MREDEDAVRSHTQFCASCKVGAFVFRSFPVLSAKFLEVSCVFLSNIVLNYSSLDFFVRLLTDQVSFFQTRRKVSVENQSARFLFSVGN